MAEADLRDDGKGLSPPYTAYQSIKTLSRDLKANGLPSRIDRSILRNFSGSVGGQVLTALKFLGLINGDSRPTEKMTALVKSYDTDTWPGALARVIREAYEPIFSLDLEKATPSEFNECFKKAFPAPDAVLRKCITFFLNAARDAQIPVSDYIMKNKKPRMAAAKKRSAKPAQKKDVESQRRNKDPDENPPLSDKSPKPLEYQLLDLIRADMDESERTAVWTLINYLKRAKAA